jgi:hypothetical protein
MENDIAGKKAQFYKDSNTPVHIKLSNDRFYNGSIKYIGADFVILDEIKFGEVCAFFIEVEDIIPYREKKE